MDVDIPASPTLAALLSGVDAWRLRSDAAPLGRWLQEELDADGAPVRLPLREWPSALLRLAEARRVRPDWPSAWDESCTGFARMLLRFTRPGGTPAIVPGGPARPRPFWKSIAKSFPAKDLGRVLDWWFPGDLEDFVPPPLPAWSAADRVLGVLRADWTSRGDLVAFDHREGPNTLFELYGSGLAWLGPGWSTASGPLETPPRVTALGTSYTADVAEWSFRPGGQEVTRLAILLRGRRLALLADLHDSGDGATMTLDVPAGLIHQSPPTPGAVSFRPEKPGRSAQAILLGSGSLGFSEESRELRVEPAPGGRWLPLLVSWDHARHRKPMTWTELTVVEQGRPCPKDIAWAARVSWGRDETFVFYRSLAPAARRSFLGCSTTARLLVGRFTPEGDVEPLVTLA